jgi:hypothetical protein
MFGPLLHLRAQSVFGARKIQAAKTRRRNQRSRPRLDSAGSQPRLKNMKMLKRLIRLKYRLSWRRRERRESALYPPPLIDPDEFARLIGSGRVEDLRILARKLSIQPKAHA